MDGWKRKLREDRGVTMLFALLFLAVAAAVSAAVLGAASGAAALQAGEKKWQQEYLSLLSASELLADCVSETAVTVSVERTTVFRSDTSASSVSYGSPAIAPAEGCALPSGLGAALCEASRTGRDCSGSFSIIPGGTASGRMQPVLASYTVTPEASEAGPEADENPALAILAKNYRLLVKNTEDGGQTLYLLADSASARSPSVTLLSRSTYEVLDGQGKALYSEAVTVERLDYSISWRRGMLSTRKEQLLPGGEV